MNLTEHLDRRDAIAREARRLGHGFIFCVAFFAALDLGGWGRAMAVGIIRGVIEHYLEGRE